MENNIKRFSMAEACSNSDGKTSGSGTSGIFLIFVGGVIGIVATVGWLMKLQDYATAYLFATSTVATGAALLGYRKSKDAGVAPQEVKQVEI